MEQKINSVSSAGTNDEASANVDVSTSSPNNAKPNVGSSALTPYELQDDWEFDDDGIILDETCPKCNRDYDEIDFEYQICNICKYNNNK